MNMPASPRLEPQPEERQSDGGLPAAPGSLAETGLPLPILADLAGKLLLLSGQLRLVELARMLRLPATVVDELLEFMRGEKLVHLVSRGITHGDVVFGLSDSGRLRAAEALQRCRYTGPAPVPLAAYVLQVRRQAVAGMRVTRADLESAYAGVALAAELRDRIGAALNSGRPLFFYGPPGSGKTFLAESLARLLQGSIAVPYAFLVDNEVVQVFDPLVHHPLPEKAATALGPRHHGDRRWLRCRRPIAITGGELRLETLDLRYDQTAGFYQAPPQVKANNGLFIVDDLGRQQVSPEQLLNRWLVPLDRGRDHLVLHTGSSFAVPFDMILAFSTNLAPYDVADEAFLRRLGYKIHVGPLADGEYREIFRQACAAAGIGYTETAAAELLELHHRQRCPPLACHPFDLLGMIRDFAVYRGIEPRVDAETLRHAWHSHFASRKAEYGPQGMAS